MKLDNDLVMMDWGGLAAEIMRLREAVRYHRDQNGDDRCFLDDVNLYQALPETVLVDTTLPPKEVFLRSCEKFHECRQGTAFSRVSELYERTKFAYTSIKDEECENA